MTDLPIRFFTAVKAFIRYEGKILLLRESKSYADGTQHSLYDVPGGRITPGEKWDDALRREIQEECGLSVTIGRPFHLSDVRIQRDKEEWQILRIFFDCQAANDNVTLSPDHDTFIWADPHNLIQQQLVPHLADVISDYHLLQGSQ